MIVRDWPRLASAALLPAKSATRTKCDQHCLLRRCPQLRQQAKPLDGSVYRDGSDDGDGVKQ